MINLDDDEYFPHELSPYQQNVTFFNSCKITAHGPIPKGAQTLKIDPKSLLGYISNKTASVQCFFDTLDLEPFSRNLWMDDIHWVRAIKLADYSSNYNVELALAPNYRPDCKKALKKIPNIILKSVKAIKHGEELRMWFSELLLSLLNIKFLDICHKFGQKYICKSCGMSFDTQIPLVMHITLLCGGIPISLLWKCLVYKMIGGPASKALNFSDCLGMKRRKKNNITDQHPDISNFFKNPKSSTQTPPQILVSIPLARLATHAFESDKEIRKKYQNLKKMLTQTSKSMTTKDVMQPESLLQVSDEPLSDSALDSLINRLINSSMSMPTASELPYNSLAHGSGGAINGAELDALASSLTEDPTFMLAADMQQSNRGFALRFDSDDSNDVGNGNWMNNLINSPISMADTDVLYSSGNAEKNQNLTSSWTQAPISMLAADVLQPNNSIDGLRSCGKDPHVDGNETWAKSLIQVPISKPAAEVQQSNSGSFDYNDFSDFGNTNWASSLSQTPISMQQSNSDSFGGNDLNDSENENWMTIYSDNSISSPTTYVPQPSNSTGLISDGINQNEDENESADVQQSENDGFVHSSDDAPNDDVNAPTWINSLTNPPMSTAETDVLYPNTSFVQSSGNSTIDIESENLASSLTEAPIYIPAADVQQSNSDDDCDSNEFENEDWINLLGYQPKSLPNTDILQPSNSTELRSDGKNQNEDENGTWANSLTQTPISMPATHMQQSEDNRFVHSSANDPNDEANGPTLVNSSTNSPLSTAPTDVLQPNNSFVLSSGIAPINVESPNSASCSTQASISMLAANVQQSNSGSVHSFHGNDPNDVDNDWMNILNTFPISPPTTDDLQANDSIELRSYVDDIDIWLNSITNSPITTATTDGESQNLISSMSESPMSMPTTPITTDASHPNNTFVSGSKKYLESETWANSLTEAPLSMPDIDVLQLSNSSNNAPNNFENENLANSLTQTPTPMVAISVVQQPNDSFVHNYDNKTPLSMPDIDVLQLSNSSDNAPNNFGSGNLTNSLTQTPTPMVASVVQQPNDSFVQNYDNKTPLSMPDIDVLQLSNSSNNGPNNLRSGNLANSLAQTPTPTVARVVQQPNDSFVQNYDNKTPLSMPDIDVLQLSNSSDNGPNNLGSGNLANSLAQTPTPMVASVVQQPNDSIVQNYNNDEILISSFNNSPLFNTTDALQLNDCFVESSINDVIGLDEDELDNLVDTLANSPTFMTDLSVDVEKHMLQPNSSFVNVPTDADSKNLVSEINTSHYSRNTMPTPPLWQTNDILQAVNSSLDSSGMTLNDSEREKLINGLIESPMSMPILWQAIEAQLGSRDAPNNGRGKNLINDLTTTPTSTSSFVYDSGNYTDSLQSEILAHKLTKTSISMPTSVLRPNNSSGGAPNADRNDVLHPNNSLVLSSDGNGPNYIATEAWVRNLAKTSQGYVCFFCKKCYSRKYNLKTHMRIHSGPNPLKCQYCDCPYRDQQSLTMHLISDHKEGRLSCFMCGKMMKTTKFKTHVECRHFGYTYDAENIPPEASDNMTVVFNGSEYKFPADWWNRSED